MARSPAAAVDATLTMSFKRSALQLILVTDTAKCVVIPAVPVAVRGPPLLVLYIA
jgi:hypothetical protein